MDLLEKSVSLTLYTDGECYLYKPDNIDGYLLLNYEDLSRNIFYKFIYDKIGDNFKKLKVGIIVAEVAIFKFSVVRGLNFFIVLFFVCPNGLIIVDIIN